MESRLIQIIESLPRSNVLLVGDMMLDKYLYGNAERVSPEAPVLVLHYQHEEIRLGGAANVASMLKTLGADVRAFGIIGNDSAGRDMCRLMGEAGIDPSNLLKDDDRPTTSKLRLVGAAQHRHAQQLMRLDYENAQQIAPRLQDAMLQGTEASMNDIQVVCLEDYNKGALPPRVCQGIIAAAKKRGIPVLVDP